MVASQEEGLVVLWWDGLIITPRNQMDPVLALITTVSLRFVSSTRRFLVASALPLRTGSCCSLFLSKLAWEAWVSPVAAPWL